MTCSCVRIYSVYSEKCIEKCPKLCFVTYIDENVARKLINDVSITEINGRKVDLRNAEPKT